MAQIAYFLGANSPGGFYSLYPELIDPERASGIYILKGGPGCGKSSFMRRVGARCEDAGITPEYIYCSGDPGSLDGVVLPALSAAVVDGTAPHVVEPKYPGLVESYVNLGQYYDRAGLQPLRREIAESMTGYQDCYKRAYRCLAAAAELEGDLRDLLRTDALEQKLAKRARSIIRREFRARGTERGEVRQRFLSAVTHQGELCLWETVEAQCTRVYALSDSFGFAHELLEPILAAATAAGYDAVACPSPMAPDRLEHLIIPSLSLAFVADSPRLPYAGRACRRIRLDSMADPELLRRSRTRLRFSKKMAAALVEEAVASLGKAKAMHDRLEGLYNPHVDFDGVYRDAEELSAALLGG